MKVFVSSLITGYEAYRSAAVAAIRSLGHEAITAETFGAGTTSPRVACLAGVRQSDLVILLLGGAYGAVQEVSGLSATNEEYEEAKDRRPLIAFVEEGVSREPLQAEFVQRVQNWSGGLLRDAYRTPEELRDLVTRGIHRHELSNASTPVDPSEMLQRALAMLPREQRGMIRSGGPLLHIGVVGGPAQAILRPVEIERPDLALKVQQSAMFGDVAIFDTAEGSKPAIKDGVLEVRQATGAAVSLDERGSILISLPIRKASGMMPAIIEEHVVDAMNRALGFAAWLLEDVDQLQRLSRFVVVAVLSDQGMGGWRTQQQQDAQPNQMNYSSGFDREKKPVHFQPPDRPRGALGFERDKIAQDLVTLLRRQWQ